MPATPLAGQQGKDMANEQYLVARSGRAKEVLENWRQDYLASHKRLVAYMDEIGAIGCFLEKFEKPYAFKFQNDTVPEGWTKPAAQGASRPKKTNKEAAKRLDDLDWCAPLEIVATRELGLPDLINVNRGGGSGRGENYLLLRGANAAAFTALWTEHADGSLGDVTLVTPDYERRMAEFQNQSDVQASWRPEGADPDVDVGFERLSKAEVDLMFSRAKAARDNVQTDPYRRDDLVEIYDFRVDDKGTFELEAPADLKERAEPLFAAGHGFVLWDPNDDVEGFLLTGETEDDLRKQFEAHAQVHFDPPAVVEAEAPSP
jgi:hypothetical protein